MPPWAAAAMKSLRSSPPHLIPIDLAARLSVGPRRWRRVADLGTLSPRHAAHQIQSTVLFMRGKRKLKRHAWANVSRSRQLPRVSLNDRTTDREPHAQAARLRGVEGAEQPVQIFRFYSNPDVLTATKTRSDSSSCVRIN